MNRPEWHKSTYSNGATNCVEAREHARGADVRDTQNRVLGFLSFPAEEWQRFLHQFRAERP
ncbi:DUF397 domain-containing protein [Nocardiopsis sp. FR4]|uniref:DUF397 domain-containing protein n=1 Tax=Nocardiopsis sp. FR4 TaxID=2605985 RepID=UPI00135B9594|nr:DUF397 domain-containing protein [Nocardiopsis sp. FR4]